MADTADTLFERGVEAHSAGRFAEAEAAYRAALERDPQHFDALHLLGVIHAQHGQPAEAARLIGLALAVDPDVAQAHNNRGLALLELGRAEEALAHFDRAIALDPASVSAVNNRGSALRYLTRFGEALGCFDHAIAMRPDYADAFGNRGVVLHQMGRHTESLASYNRALALTPQNPAMFFNRGTLLQSLSRNAEALADYDRALALHPQYASAHDGRGAALWALGRFPEALAACDQALALRPDFTEAHIHRGNILTGMQRFDEALSAFDAALLHNPSHDEALNNKGNVLRALKRPQEALAAYDHAMALQPSSNAAGNRALVLKDMGRGEEALVALDAVLARGLGSSTVFHNRGLILQDMGRQEDALGSYDSALALSPAMPGALSDRAAALIGLERWNEAAASAAQAVALAPTHADALYNLATALQHLGHLDDAVAHFDRAIAEKPDYAAAFNNRGVVLQLQNRTQEARDSFDRAVALDPSYSEAAAAAFSLSCQLCDWKGWDARQGDVIARVRARQTVTPFIVFPASDSPDIQMHAAADFAAARYPAQTAVTRPQAKPHDRIRIGYVSADFHNHATAQLIAEMIERHDRTRFEIYAFSLGLSDNTPLRARLEAGFDHFIEVADLTDSDIAARMAAEDIDIAVDLKGYTKDCRPRIFAYRPAPIAVSYLGYPGTTGAPYIDYVLADAYVAPEHDAAFFSERIVTLPGCYQVNDSTKPVDPATPSRVSLGLPETGFVFCSFNGNYKINPQIFDIWMRLLQVVDGSVLWLYADNDIAKANLAREAQARGVAAERIVFADFAELPQHLARMVLADLFLDTNPVCAHTTASDAAWAGLPLLTCAGESFVARVAGSLLTTLGLPELITNSLEEYEATALALARNPARLRDLRERLARAKTASPLFDCARFTRQVESAYAQMWARHSKGRAPEAFAVERL